MHRRKSVFEGVTVLKFVRFSTVERMCHQSLVVIQLRKELRNEICSRHVPDGFYYFLADWKVLGKKKSENV